MEIIGYARVSTLIQDLTTQLEYLNTQNCTKIFAEKQSGKNVNSRKELQAMLKFVQAGDVVHFVKLDRIGRSTVDNIAIIQTILQKGATICIGGLGTICDDAIGRLILTMFSAFAEYERSLIIERTAVGREEAKKKGVQFGRKRSITPLQEQHILYLREEQKLTLAEIGAIMKLHRQTIQTVYKRLRPERYQDLC